MSCRPDCFIFHDVDHLPGKLVLRQGQGDRGTKGQVDRQTDGQGDRGTGRQRDR